MTYMFLILTAIISRYLKNDLTILSHLYNKVLHPVLLLSIMTVNFKMLYKKKKGLCQSNFFVRGLDLTSSNVIVNKEYILKTNYTFLFILQNFRDTKFLLD